MRNRTKMYYIFFIHSIISLLSKQTMVGEGYRSIQIKPYKWPVKADNHKNLIYNIIQKCFRNKNLKKKFSNTKMKCFGWVSVYHD